MWEGIGVIVLTGSWHPWFLWKLSWEPPESGSRWDLWREKERQKTERERQTKGERETGRKKTLVEVFQALKDIRSQMINKTTNIWSMPHTHTLTHAHTHTHNVNYSTKAQKEKEMERAREGTDDMTFMISETVWSKELQRQKELSEILLAWVHLPPWSVCVPTRVCVFVCVCD